MAQQEVLEQVRERLRKLKNYKVLGRFIDWKGNRRTIYRHTEDDPPDTMQGETLAMLVDALRQLGLWDSPEENDYLAAIQKLRELSDSQPSAEQRLDRAEDLRLGQMDDQNDREEAEEQHG